MTALLPRTLAAPGARVPGMHLLAPPPCLPVAGVSGAYPPPPFLLG